LAALRGLSGRPRHRRDAHDITQDANRERLALIVENAELHFGGSEKMRSFLGSLRSFSRRRRAFSVAKSRPAGGIAACVLGRRGDPAWLPPLLLRQARSRAAGIPSSPGNLTQRPAAASQKLQRLPLKFIRISMTCRSHKTLSCSKRSLAKVSTTSAEGHDKSESESVQIG
jgi:hypothetical protein